MEVSFENSRASFDLDSREWDLEKVRRAVMEAGFSFDLAEPVRIAFQSATLGVSVTAKDARNKAEEEGEVRVTLSATDDAPVAGLKVAIFGPNNVEGLSAEPRTLARLEKEELLAFPYRVARPARPRFLLFRVEIEAEGIEKIELPVAVQLDR
ncbi:MAG: hypothetical protein HY720_25025 [Planctomycetes bacterium]|nr:hypothetical protein [Planctomycetota bacterium]